MKRVVVTGAVGLVGAEVVRRLAARPGLELVLLVGAEDQSRAERAVEPLMASLGRPAASLETLAVDLRAPRFGLSLAAWGELAATVDTVFHLAHLESPTLSAAAAQAAHVGPVETWVRFLREAPEARLHHLSTGLVGGTRQGLLTEFDLEVGQGFRNPYERSRHEAERRLRGSACSQRATIARVSHVVGDSVSGEHFADGGAYPLLQALLARPGFVPADPGARIDLVPVDYVADALVAVAEEPSMAGRTFHLVSGWHRSLPVAELLARMGGGRRRSRPLPPLAAPVLRLAGTLTAGWAAPRGGEFTALSHYLRQTCVFDDFLARAFLVPRGLSCPDPRDYLDRILAVAADPARRVQPPSEVALLGPAAVAHPAPPPPRDPAFRKRLVVRVGDYDVAYRDIGRGEPVVFLHGFSGASAWDGVVERLAPHFRCLVVETLGLGDTAAPLSADYTLPAQAAMVRGFLSTLELDAVHLVGHDTGGAIAQLLAVRWPFVVRRLVLSDCDAFDNWPPPQVERLKRAMRLPGMARLLTMLLRIPAVARSSLGFRNLVYDRRLLTRDRLAEYLRPVAADRARVRRMRRFFLSLDPACTRDIVHLLQELARPTMIVWGCEDAYWSTSWAQRLYDEIPGAERLELIPFAGLSCHEERPDHFARLLLEFFAADAGDAEQRPADTALEPAAVPVA
jgi:pimeloyl-ACP methyl ester carboxylesterase/nucleoside-diphosphate-sugar epimerase